MDNKKIDIVMGQGPELVDFYRSNPCIAAYDLLGVDLAPIQRIVFEDMWFRDYTISVCSRGFGKTYLLGTLATLSALLYPGYRVGLVGPSFRQAKMIFAEVEKHYAKSAILKEAAVKAPVRGSDTSYLKLKSVGDKNGSFIEALPLGNDGAKIRGSRFYLICTDELAQIPTKILDMVLRPMGATKQDPMANVRQLELQRKLIESGLATEDDFEDEQVNKMVMTSSGYYKFNHMYSRMRSYWDKIELEGYENSRCMVHQIPYTLLPEGFLDKGNVEEARRVMSDHEFRMEYEASMISDSEGFFKASLLEMCTMLSAPIETTGDSKAQYVIGVDPNQAGSASCGIVVIKVGTVNTIVNVVEAKGSTTQDLVSIIQDICNDYNVVRVFMDKGGGGKAIMDLLEEGYGDKEPIIDRTNPDHISFKGKHILEMINFNPEWISDANFDTLSLLENNRLIFPGVPIQENIKDNINDVYNKIVDLKKQMLNIVITQTATGKLHFDTPKKGQNKDLYSALILAAYGVRVIEKELEIDDSPILCNNSGMVRNRNEYSWDNITNISSITTPTNKLSMALLTKKPKK